MAITGNRGEWSEVYVLFRLLADGRLYPADGNLNRIREICYPIIKILRKELETDLEFVRNKDITIVDGRTQEVIALIPAEEFAHNADFLLSQIKSNTGTFSVCKTERFMQTVGCRQLKATVRDKSDIVIVIHDQRTGFDPELGFSIKSRLGRSATLLNASQSTNFLYRVTAGSADRPSAVSTNRVGAAVGIRDLLSGAEEVGWTIEFQGLQSEVFAGDLQMIDTLMPQILAELLLLYYRGKASRLSELTELIASRNALGLNREYALTAYKYKIKNFLTAVALGMTPRRVWNGDYDSTGGYIVVKENGDVLCYHVFNWNQFREYLYRNTKLETASTSRHKFGNLYFEEGECYLKLNLQIRFL